MPVLVILNSTISGNVAKFEGGGIENFLGDVTLVFSTVTANSAEDDGGGLLNDGDVTIKNSLVVENLTGGDCADFGSSFDAVGNNIDTDETCPGFATFTSGQVDLGPLADNGGPTPTHALGSDSVAVDAASDCTDDKDALVETDQRGVARPQGSDCDIGAFEREPPSSPGHRGGCIHRPARGLLTNNAVGRGRTPGAFAPKPPAMRGRPAASSRTMP